MRALLAVGLLVSPPSHSPSRASSSTASSVPGATTALLTDLTYAPAGDFARALGADAAVDAGSGPGDADARGGDRAAGGGGRRRGR
jgi:hypothetical protein